MNIYRCFFNFLDEVKSTTSDRGIRDFDTGFWINSRFEYKPLEDIKYWIPPSQILYIVRIKEANHE